MIEVTLLGTGSPLPDPHRAGPATLVRAGSATFLVDAGRGVVMRAAGAGSGPNQLTAVLLTHLHSDHVTDLGDLVTTRWITTFEPSPLIVVGPPGTKAVTAAVLESLAPDVGYRTTHHADLDGPPPVHVQEVSTGVVWDADDVIVRVGATDHRPVEPTLAFRIEHDGAAVVVAGDTVPCASLDALCAGADALVITAIRRDLLEPVPLPRLQDILDYHSSVEDAARTATRAGVGTLVLTHYVPAPVPGAEDEWRAVAAAHFAGRIELGDDLHAVRIG
ncbi:ribonuclease Z [Nocardioides hankookensis]|uniref:Ribonuclease Z n=1 Tax=Nocardioides hankookensis TaxID=443157 RepID=A0ABW1LL19_9ACTN